MPGMKENDLAYEPPRYYANDTSHAQAYDYGPCKSGEQYTCALAKDLQEGWPAFDEVEGQDELISDPSFGHGPVYRGKLEDSEVLVLADQMSHDDFFSTRALTGLAGQRLQQALYLAKAEGNYGILRTLPVDTLKLREGRWTVSDKLVAASASKINGLISNVISNKKIVVVIGEAAWAAWDRYAESQRVEANLNVVKVDAPTESNVDQYKELIREISRALQGRAVWTSRVNEYASGEIPVARPIPREDLPYSSRWWMGTSGNRVVRPLCTNCEPGGDRRSDADPMGDYYTAHAPEWVSRDLMDITRTTEEDKEEIARIKDLLVESRR